MQIQNFPSIQFSSINSLKSPKIYNSLNDSVSFKGNPEPKTERMKQAEDFGLNLYALFENGNFNNGAVQTEARKSIPKIRVENINELKKIFGNDVDVSRYNAYLLPSYKNDCTLKSLIMYIKQDKTDVEKIASAAHEYTHALQYVQNDDYMGIAPLVDGDLYKARALNSFGFHVFNEIERNLKIGEIFDEAAQISEEKGIDIKDAFIQAGGFKDEKDCKRAFKHCYLETYDGVQAAMSKSPDYSYVPFQNDPLKLKRTIRTICKDRAEREKEAYTVQRDVTSMIDKNSLTGENKVSPVFYEIMAEALS